MTQVVSFGLRRYKNVYDVQGNESYRFHYNIKKNENSLSSEAGGHVIKGYLTSSFRFIHIGTSLS